MAFSICYWANYTQGKTKLPWKSENAMMDNRLAFEQGSYGQGKSGNFEGVRESRGKQRGSGKSQGILKYCSLDQLFVHYFHNFCWLLGALPPDPHRGSALVNTAG